MLSAAKDNQTSQSIEEAKHGLFSYYMMLGMEGGADTNNDNKITASELFAFIKKKLKDNLILDKLLTYSVIKIDF